MERHHVGLLIDRQCAVYGGFELVQGSGWIGWKLRVVALQPNDPRGKPGGFARLLFLLSETAPRHFVWVLPPTSVRNVAAP